MTANDTKPAFGNRAVAVFVVLFLAVQILVPIVQLTRPLPTHFGWQMFSVDRPLPRYWVVLDDGTERDIDVYEHIGVRRLDADYHRAFPEYLCRTYPAAVAVRWQWPDRDEMEELRCSR
ncbi:MAG: hypothetical protein L0Y71_25370 [Gemmataceae bacterium]|nr:hypothetical protein [Gemmataceae bacterium]